MKKVYAALLLLLSTVPALAQTADSNKNTKEGVIKLLDGTKEIKSFSAKHLKITFSDGKVHFTQMVKQKVFHSPLLALSNFQ